MSEQIPTQARLEQLGGNSTEVRQTCSIGRAASNQIVLSDDKVSRRHAIVHAQGENEFWLVDLGSSNGTFVNGRRVTQPIQLCDQDEIEIGQFRLVFHHAQTPRMTSAGETNSDKTIQ